MSNVVRVGSINSAYPENSTPLGASSGNVANASAVATLTCPADKTAYISQFTVTGSGATAGLPVVVTVTGLLGGTQSFVFTFPAGVLVGAVPLDVDFPIPLPASGIGTNIVVTCPAGGAGNTNAAVSATGYAL
jgi:hypothetical protein